MFTTVDSLCTVHSVLTVHHMGWRFRSDIRASIYSITTCDAWMLQAFTSGLFGMQDLRTETVESLLFAFVFLLNFEIHVGLALQFCCGERPRSDFSFMHQAQWYVLSSAPLYCVLSLLTWMRVDRPIWHAWIVDSYLISCSCYFDIL